MGTVSGRERHGGLRCWSEDQGQVHHAQPGDRASRACGNVDRHRSALYRGDEPILARAQSFGQTINQFGQIQAHLATSYAEYAAARAYVYATSNDLDLNATGSNRLDSDGVKLVASVMGTTVANRAM